LGPNSVEWLGNYPEAFPLLTKIAQEERRRSDDAMDALFKIDKAKAFPIIAKLAPQGEFPNHHAVELLTQYGPDALPTLERLATTENPSQRIAIEAIKQIKSYPYEPQAVTLIGKIISKPYFSFSDYDEPSRKIQKAIIYLLKLDSPIRVQGDPTDVRNTQSFENVSELQLLDSQLHHNFKEYLGNTVEIKGALSQAISRYCYTKVLLNVLAIKNAEPHKVVKP
jgi:hypothetical protein